MGSKNDEESSYNLNLDLLPSQPNHVSSILEVGQLEKVTV